MPNNYNHRVLLFHASPQDLSQIGNETIKAIQLTRDQFSTEGINFEFKLVTKFTGKDIKNAFSNFSPTIVHIITHGKSNALIDDSGNKIISDSFSFLH